MRPPCQRCGKPIPKTGFSRVCYTEPPDGRRKVLCQADGYFTDSRKMVLARVKR
jgi:hypothetical protein